MRPCRQQTKKVMSTWSLTIYDSGVQCFFCFPEVLIISLHHNGGRPGQVGGGRGDNRERYWWGFLRPEEGDGGHLDTGHVSRWARAQPAVILNWSDDSAALLQNGNGCAGVTSCRIHDIHCALFANGHHLYERTFCNFDWKQYSVPKIWIRSGIFLFQQEHEYKS